MIRIEKQEKSPSNVNIRFHGELETYSGYHSDSNERQNSQTGVLGSWLLFASVLIDY